MIFLRNLLKVGEAGPPNAIAASFLLSASSIDNPRGCDCLYGSNKTHDEKGAGNIYAHGEG